MTKTGGAPGLASSGIVTRPSSAGAERQGDYSQGGKPRVSAEAAQTVPQVLPQRLHGNQTILNAEGSRFLTWYSMRSVDLPVNPPVLPMLSKRVAELPVGETWI